MISLRAAVRTSVVLTALLAPFTRAAVPVDLSGLAPDSEIRITHDTITDLITLDWPASASASGPRASLTLNLTKDKPLLSRLAWQTAPANDMPLVSWVALGYVALFSMWIGFFAWYRGLVLGGVMGVSQVQSLQPFMGILVSIPLLNEQWSWVTISFAMAVVVTVYVAKNRLASQQ